LQHALFTTERQRDLLLALAFSKTYAQHKSLQTEGNLMKLIKFIKY
jgi:hypothetical protein